MEDADWTIEDDLDGETGANANSNKFDFGFSWRDIFSMILSGRVSPGRSLGYP